MGTYCVYIHTNKTNHKRYVGYTQDSNPTKRWGLNGVGYKKCPYFWSAIQKYGWDGFIHEVLITGLTHKEVQNRERFYISLFRTNQSKYGYNLTMGGDGHDLGKDCHNPEVQRINHQKYHEVNRDKIRIHHKNDYETNKEYYLEYQKNYRETHPEIKETQKAYRDSHKEEKHLYDIEYHKKNKEHKREVDKAYRERKKAENPKVYKKKIKCTTTVEIFESIQAASDHFGICYASVSQCVRGMYKQTHGLSFEFL